MKIATPQNWTDYELLDTGNGERLERFGSVILVRPDPQIIWKKSLPQSEWDKSFAIFKRLHEDKGRWVIKKKLPKNWLLSYQGLAFYSKLSPFKHTGIFPEQAVQWDFITKNIQSRLAEDPKTPISVLNLFGYTGIASLAAAKAGAKVTHIDASYSTIGWAKDNQKASKLADKPIRWILDDALKFCQREVRRGVKYDAIIMDPPIFGHGPNGELWKFSESFPKLLEVCSQLLSNNPLFIIINAYAISSSALMLENMLKDLTKNLGGEIEVGELVLQESSSAKRLLSTGIYGRWHR